MDTQHAILSGPQLTLPRDRRLFFLTEISAAAEAEGALKAASLKEKRAPGPLADTLAAASTVWNGGRSETRFLAEDTTALARLQHLVTSPEFLALVPDWVRELRQIAADRPDTGACTLATAFQLWSWTMHHFLASRTLSADVVATATSDLAEALCPLLAARCFVLALADRTAAERTTVDTVGERSLRSDLCHVHTAHASALVAAECAELVFGYRRHLRWDAAGCAACYGADELDELEGFMPGIASSARAVTDVIEVDGSHAIKAGPCVRFDGVDAFVRLRTRLDGCLTGARLAKERAAAALARNTFGATLPDGDAEGD